MPVLPDIPPRQHLAQLPTPLRRLKRLSDELGTNIWLKSDDLSGFTLSGNKVRKLEFLLADALKKHATVVITCGGVQSNHCRATAFACAQLGLKCHLILRSDISVDGKETVGEGNHFLDQLCGASYEVHPQTQFAKMLSERFSEAQSRFASEGERSYSIPTGGSNGLGVWGYIGCAYEIYEQSKESLVEPDYVVCASGSGGTQAGLTLGLNELMPDTKVLGFAVCDDKNYFLKKVTQDITLCLKHGGWSDERINGRMENLTIDTNDQYIGPGYALGYDEVYECIRQMARLEGLLLDPVYTGKAFWGMINEIKRGALDSAQNVVFVHTGGGFGVFPQARQLI